jgi:hypothetical protein
MPIDTVGPRNGRRVEHWVNKLTRENQKGVSSRRSGLGVGAIRRTFEADACKVRFIVSFSIRYNTGEIDIYSKGTDGLAKQSPV